MQRVDRIERAQLRLEVHARLQQPRVLEDGEELDSFNLAVLRHDRQQARAVVGRGNVAEEDGRGRGRGNALVEHGALHAQHDGLLVLRDVHHATVETFQRSLAVRLLFELHEAVAAAAAGVYVNHHARAHQRAVLVEPREEQVVVDRDGQVADVEVRQRLVDAMGAASRSEALLLLLLLQELLVLLLSHLLIGEDVVVAATAARELSGRQECSRGTLSALRIEGGRQVCRQALAAGRVVGHDGHCAALTAVRVAVAVAVVLVRVGQELDGLVRAGGGGEVVAGAAAAAAAAAAAVEPSRPGSSNRSRSCD